MELKRLALVPIAVYASLVIICFCASGADRVVCHFSDDAYFYFTIARNVVNEGKLTFDGTSTTNGFHPLWMLFVLPVLAAIEDRIAALRIVGTLSTLLLAGAGIAGLRHVARRYSPLAAALSAALLAKPFAVLCDSGMETSLLLPLAVGALLLLLSERPWSAPSSRTARLAGIGVLLALAELARLDAAFLSVSVVVVVFVGAAARFGLRTAVARAGAIALPPLVAGAAYLLANVQVFGHMVRRSRPPRNPSEVGP